jgi:hypothetical protein
MEISDNVPFVSDANQQEELKSETMDVSKTVYIYEIR